MVRNVEDLNLAKRLVENLRTKGWTAHILSKRDPEGRLVHSVRLPPRDDLDEVLEESVRFANKEGVQVEVALADSVVKFDPSRPVAQTAKSVPAPAPVPAKNETAETLPPPSKELLDNLRKPNQEASSNLGDFSSADKVWGVRVGSFAGKDSAQKAVEIYKKKGYDAYILFLYSDRDQWFHVVQVGKFKSREEAAAEAKRIEDRERIAPGELKPMGLNPEVFFRLK